MFDRGCQLVILACNTASAKALRTIQQEYLPLHAPARRVLGVIRPTVEALPGITRNGHIALMATAGTVASNSYKMEVGKIDPAMTITQQACPLFVPLIENGEADSEGAAYFVKKYIAELLARDPQTDTILLGCTHYPIIADLIRSHLPPHIKVIEQGELVGQSLKDYLHRHTEMEHKCLHSPGIEFITTEDPEKFNTMTKLFMGCQCDSTNVTLG